MDGRLKDAKLETERAYHQRRANSLRQLGLCVRCGKPNSEPRYATCPECRARQRKRMKARAFRDAMQTVHPARKAVWRRPPRPRGIAISARGRGMKPA